MVTLHVIKRAHHHHHHQLDREGYAKAIARPKPTTSSPAAADGKEGRKDKGHGAAFGATAAAEMAEEEKEEAAAASVVRKLERQFATLRGVMLVFGDNQEE